MVQQEDIHAEVDYGPFFKHLTVCKVKLVIELK